MTWLIVTMNMFATIKGGEGGDGFCISTYVSSNLPIMPIMLFK